MRVKMLSGVAAFAFVATGAAFAQDNPSKEQRPAPRMETRPPAAAAAPRAMQAEPRREQPAQAETRQPAAPRAVQAEPRRDQPAAAPRAAQTEPRREQPAQAETRQPAAAPRAAQGERRDQMKSGEARPAMNDNAPRNAETERRDQPGQPGARSAQERGTPRVQGNVHMSTEHAMRVGQSLREHGQPERVNVNVRVGERLPETVVVRPLPEDVVTLVPEYRGYDYFVDADDEIVFVSPETHQIVGMIDYGSEDGPVVAGARPCPVEN